MAPEDVPKTAVVTPFGLYEFLCMPFGLKNAAQSFQRLMDRLFRDIPYAFVYFDDVLVASRTPEEHLRHLTTDFDTLSAAGLVVNLEKCFLAQPEVEFLGHQVSSTGCRPLTRHVEALRDFPPPTDIKALQRFLGPFNFFRRFVPLAAAILRPLTDALGGNPRHLPWSPVMHQAFDRT